MNQDKACVLVVDDDEKFRDLLIRMITHQGYAVQCADNGRSALDMLAAHTFDLILLDIMMPHMNGFQLLERLKTNATWRKIPVIIISADDQIDSIVKGIELGAEDYLTRPFNHKLLNARIQASLEKKWLFDQEHKRLKELAVMQQIDAELNATLDVRRVMAITLKWAMRQTGGDAGIMGPIIDNHIHVLASSGYNYEVPAGDTGSLMLPYESPAVDESYRMGHIAYVADTAGIGLLAHTRSQIAVPIKREKQITAMLLLESMEPNFWQPSVTAFLQRLATHAAIAVANAQLYEAVQHANEAKTEFVSFVSHELKSPMTTINGYTDLLLSNNFGDLNTAQTQFLQTMHANLKRMMHLVSDLEDISRIEAGQLFLDSQAIPFSELVNEILESTRAQIEAKAQTLKVDLADQLPEMMGDRHRLVQIFTNLVSNAYKYTPEHGRITISANRILEMNGHQQPKPMVHVTIEDNGLGIREEDQAGIFSKFYRGHDEKILQINGTGLGLNITKNLVELHNGRIWFESKYRHGTTFHVVIPAQISA